MKRLSFTTLVALVVCCSMLSGTVSAAVPSSWAAVEVNAAIKLDIVPQSLHDGYTKPITRAEFCELMVRLLTVKQGKSIDDILKASDKQTSNVFTDTTDRNILAAYALGIVNGVGNNRFAPNNEITRQEAATMLVRAASLLGRVPSASSALSFSDRSLIDSWARGGVVAATSVLKDATNNTFLMTGTGNNKFSPLNKYTREQAIITAKRLYNAIPVDSAKTGPKEIGFFDRDYDYTQHKKFKFAYLASFQSDLVYTFDVAFQQWADALNMEYGGLMCPPISDSEDFLLMLEAQCQLGYEGFILDMDSSISKKATDICDKYGIKWMMGIGSQLRDYSVPYSIMGQFELGPLLGASVGLPNFDAGVAMGNALIEWKKQAHPGVPWDQVGMIAIGWSSYPPFNDRALGAKKAWAEKNPSFGVYSPNPASELKNFFYADAATDANGGELVKPVLSAYSDIKVWLIEGAVWNYAMRAAQAAENLGMIDNVAVTSFANVTHHIALWDSGTPTCIRFTLEIAAPVISEAICNSLWAMMDSIATKETLWPEWRIVWDKGDVFEFSDEPDPVTGLPVVKLGSDGKPIVEEEHNYASLQLPIVICTKDNYKEFYGWSDLYQFGPNATPEQRNYPDYPLPTDLYLYPSRAAVPKYYNTWPNQ